MKGLFIPDITAEMFRSGCLESIEALMAEGEIYDIEYEPKQQWIPVSERLPEAGVRYQVTFESGEVGYADFRNKIFLSDGSAKENVWETERYYEDDGEVIAWSPMPEPYKEGDE